MKQGLPGKLNQQRATDREVYAMRWYNWVGLAMSIIAVMAWGLTGLVYVIIGVILAQILSR
jgi:hypothetical protein